MGTTVHCKSYSPVCYSLSDLNKNGNRVSWPQSYKDKTVNSGHYFDHLLQMQTTDVYSENDKEEVKQAMLKHETIFRNQVYELHRLYAIQKDYMDKLKRKELHKFQVPMDASLSTPFLSQIQVEDVQKLRMSPQNLLADSSCNRPSAWNRNTMQSLVNFNKKSHMQIGPPPNHNKLSLINSELLESTSKKSPIKKIDLQLPADEYLASEDTDQIEKEKVARVNVESYPFKKCCRSGVSDGVHSCQGDAYISETSTECKHGLADLNEPAQVEDATTVSPVRFIDLVSSHRDTQVKNLCSNPSSLFVGLSMEYLHNTWRGRDDQACININNLEKKCNQQELEKLSHQSDSCSRSSSVSSWIKPKRIPCVKPCASMSRSPKMSILSPDTNLRLTSSCGSEVSQQNGIFHELQSHSNSSQSRFGSVGFDYNCYDRSVALGDAENHNTVTNFMGSKCPDANSTKANDLNGIFLNALQVEMPHQKDFLVGNEGKALRGSPMPRMKPTCNGGTSERREASKQVGLDFLHELSLRSTCEVGRENSASYSLNPEYQMIEVGDTPNTGRIPGFPVVNKLCVSKAQVSLSLLPDSLQYPSEAVETPNTAKVQKFHTGLSCDLAKSNSYSCRMKKKKKGLAKSTRKVTEIDLEVPADLDSMEGNSAVCEESLRNQLKTCVQSSQIGKDALHELFNIAAETIVSISTSGNRAHLEDSTCASLEASQGDSLHWFAEVITPVTGDLESMLSVDDDGMDYFESMTLKLTETKFDDYCSEHLMPEYLGDVTEAPSMMTQRGRGKGRRGGQQRNFQRDVLPGFASLTKHEISEDLEMLEGLMRSMGHSWQIGKAVGNAARNGRAKGKRHSRGSARAGS